jgi:hypothetical protein
VFDREGATVALTEGGVNFVPIDGVSEDFSGNDLEIGIKGGEGDQ